MTTMSGRVLPRWSYKPGPDVDPVPPAGLVRAQSIAREAADAGLRAAAPGATEQQIDIAIAASLRAHQVDHVWTVTTVGAGENARICFPTHPPTDNLVKARDVVTVDVHPITADGSWGDCTRCRVIGDYPAAAAALADLTAIHHATLAACRPGMSAQDLFGICNDRLTTEGFVLLDLLANIGHSLTSGAAYLHRFIDAGNDAPMWAAWAIEPFAERDGIAVKVEDLVWFGRDTCTVI